MNDVEKQEEISIGSSPLEPTWFDYYPITPKQIEWYPLLTKLRGKLGTDTSFRHTIALLQQEAANRNIPEKTREFLTKFVEWVSQGQSVFGIDPRDDWQKRVSQYNEHKSRLRNGVDLESREQYLEWSGNYTHSMVTAHDIDVGNPAFWQNIDQIKSVGGIEVPGTMEHFIMQRTKQLLAEGWEYRFSKLLAYLKKKLTGEM